MPSTQNVAAHGLLEMGRAWSWQGVAYCGADEGRGGCAWEERLVTNAMPERGLFHARVAGAGAGSRAEAQRETSQ